MRLIVGLGNPGKKYQGTRHNVGFEIVERIAGRYQATRREKFQSEWLEGTIGSVRVALQKPLTYMNRSGSSVQAAASFFKIPIESILVICDDFNLPLGRLRFRKSGSAGGQKGLQDILTRLGTQEVARLRVGIGPTPPAWDPADFVLGQFSETERVAMQPVLGRGADAVVDWIQRGIDACMNRYNAETPQEKREGRVEGVGEE